MKITPKQYAESLLSALESVKPSDHDCVIDNFLKVLSQNGDIGFYGKIVEEFEKIDKKKKGIGQAQITTAKEMEINSGLINQLNEIIGKKIEVKQKVDAGILGGVVVRVDGTLIDASVKTQLNNLNQSLKS